MPAAFAPDDEKPVKPNITYQDTPFSTPVVDTRKQSYDTVSTFIQGSRLACDYFSQTQTKDVEATSFQEDLPYPFNQLTEIKGFELILDGSLNHDQVQDDSRGFNSTGSAFVYSVVTPQIGDIFIADLFNNMNVLCQVTDTKANGPFTEASSKIEFRVVRTLDKSLYENIRRRVVKTLYFFRENMRNGIKALLTQEEVDITRRLGEAYRRLTAIYMRDFYSTRFMSIMVPDQTNSAWDPYLTNYVKATFDSNLAPGLSDVMNFNVSGSSFRNQMTLWDVLLNRDSQLLYSCCRKAGLADMREYFSRRAVLRSVYFTGIAQIVSVQDVHWTIDSQDKLPPDTQPFCPSKKRQTDMRSVLPVLDLSAEGNHQHKKTLIKAVTVDDHYVFSEAFYENKRDEMSVLEYLVRDRIEVRTFSLDELADVADEAHAFDNLERFYYIPIILSLIKLAPGVL